MKTESKRTGRAILLAFGITSLVMMVLIFLCVYIFPSYPYVKHYEKFTEKMVEELAEKGITVRGDCELIGGWKEHYLLWQDRNKSKVILRFPETTPLEEIVSSESWYELKEPEYDPPAREKELGDFTFTKEARGRGDRLDWIYLTEVIDGYYYLRICLNAWE